MSELRTWIRAQWDRVGAGLAAVAGLVALLLGWLGASDAVLPAAQIPYVMSGGLVGLFLCGVAATLWLSADLRDEWRELHKIEQHLAVGRTESSSVHTNGHVPAAAAGPETTGASR